MINNLGCDGGGYGRDLLFELLHFCFKIYALSVVKKRNG